jgi:ring-1,2-phenylacetyl-CoA epoxidase subunit PaaD
MVRANLGSEAAALPAAARAIVERAWALLGNIPDPEIPVISIVELGIVRGIAFDGDVLVIRVTPTYSGCPATAVIAGDIERALDAAAMGRFRVETALSPPWTTDWIVPEARERLRLYGIAPPAGAAPVRTVDVSRLARGARMEKSVEKIACPRCGSARTREVSPFGSTPCKAQYRCEDCLEPFDYFKPH